MKFRRRYWYWIGGVIFIGLAFVMAVWGGSHLPTIQTILILSWMAMLIHQVEEYGFPGRLSVHRKHGRTQRKGSPGQIYL